MMHKRLWWYTFTRGVWEEITRRDRQPGVTFPSKVFAAIDSGGLRARPPYSIRSERQLVERLEFDLLFRWFVGLGIDDAVWDGSSFSKNRDRLLTTEVAQGLAACPCDCPSVDEKSQIQALDRTQPGLPMKKGRAGTMTHDDKRHGTTTLFAALNVLDGSVIGRNMQRHRHQEFIRLLNTIEARLPKDKAVHVILDNYATHKQPKVRTWLARHPRWTFHFVPTSCSWLNAVEGFFAKLTRRRLKNGVFHSVVDLQAAINRFIKERNEEPKPFIWKANPDDIIAAVRRGHQVLESNI